MSIGDVPVTGTRQLLNAVAAMRPQAVAALGVQRGDKALGVNVTVGERSAARAVQPREE